METTIDISTFASSLGLAQNNGDVFFGKRRGFAVGFKVINPLDNPLLLFQVRYPLKADASEVQAVRYDGAVEGLRKDKKLEVEFDDRLAWVTFVDGAGHLLDGSIAKLLDSILDSFTAAGLGRNLSRCHYCLREEVKEPSCIDGKVALICPACLSEKVNAPENLPAEASEGALPIGMLAPLAATVGAMGWAGFWIGFILVLEFLAADKVYVPRLVEAAILVCVGFLTGGPVGLVIKRVQRRGRNLSMAFSVVCSIAAVVLGEVAFVAWLIYREFKVISPSVAWQILPQIEMELGGFHLVVKLLAAGVAVGVAVTMAKPGKPKLKL